MKTWQKIAVLAIGSIAALPVIIIVAVLLILPDPASLGRAIRRRTTAKVTVVTAPLAAKIILNTVTPFPTAATPAPVILTDPVERKRLVSEKFVERYLTDDRMQSRVCENLENSPAPFKGTEQFGKQIESTLLGESKPSATVEAVMLPIEYTLKNEAVRDLVRSAEEAAANGDTGFLRKSQFYAQAAVATASILSSREQFELISANAYRLYAIARAAALKPSILQDADLRDLCRGFERAALDGLPSDDLDRARLLRMLERNGIAPASIDYDPNMTTNLSIVNSDGGFRIKTQWLEKVFKAQ